LRLRKDREARILLAGALKHRGDCSAQAARIFTVVAEFGRRISTFPSFTVQMYQTTQCSGLGRNRDPSPRATQAALLFGTRLAN